MTTDHSAPEAWRCPECLRALSASRVCWTEGCPNEAAYIRDDDTVSRGAIVPTPAPEGGEAPSIVLLNARRDPSYSPYCMRCAGLQRMRKVEDFYWRCPACPAEHDERENAKRLATPTSAEGGEAEQPWPFKCPRCQSNAAHGYCQTCKAPTPAPEGGVLEKCPRPHHLLLPGERCTDCSFTPTSAEGGEAKCPGCGSTDPRTTFDLCEHAFHAPTLAATGEEAQMRVLDGLAVLQDKLGDEGQSFRAKAAKDAEDLILSLRRQLAEAERAARYEADVAQQAIERATTAERQRDEAIRALGTEARMRGSAEQEVARLRDDHAAMRPHIDHAITALEIACEKSSFDLARDYGLESAVEAEEMKARWWDAKLAFLREWPSRPLSSPHQRTGRGA